MSGAAAVANAGDGVVIDSGAGPGDGGAGVCAGGGGYRGFDSRAGLGAR